MRSALWTVLLFSACTPPAKEPEPEVSDPAFAVLRDFAKDGVEESVGLLLKQAEENADLVEGVALDGPDISQLTDITFSSNADPESLVGAAIATVVEGNLDGYAAVVPEADQTFCDPQGFETWNRTILEGDETAFLAHEGELKTDNDIVKNAVIYKVPYPTEEDYRWVQVDGEDVLIARSWLYEEGVSEDGGVTAVAAFQVEIQANVDAGVRWYVESWTQIISIGNGEDLVRSQLLAGLSKCFTGTASHVNP